MLFNPQFVFGNSGEFALQFKVPVTALYPYAADAPTQFGLGAVSTAFAWNFMSGKGVRQFLALGLQIETASTPVDRRPLGARALLRHRDRAGPVVLDHDPGPVVPLPGRERAPTRS